MKTLDSHTDATGEIMPVVNGKFYYLCDFRKRSEDVGNVARFSGS